MFGEKVLLTLVLVFMLSYGTEGLFSKRRSQLPVQQPAIVNHVHSSNINDQNMVNGKPLSYGAHHQPEYFGHGGHPISHYPHVGHAPVHYGHNTHGYHHHQPSGGAASAAAAAGGGAASASAAAAGAGGGENYPMRMHYPRSYHHAPACSAPPCYGGMF